MEDVNKTWVSRILTKEEGEEEVSSPQLSSIPSLLWAQVYHKLQPLVELNMGTGGCHVIQWSHRYFKEFAESRYLQSEDQARSIYKSLADYFSGKYSYSQGREVSIPIL